MPYVQISETNGETYQVECSLAEAAKITKAQTRPTVAEPIKSMRVDARKFPEVPLRQRKDTRL